MVMGPRCEKAYSKEKQNLVIEDFIVKKRNKIYGELRFTSVHVYTINTYV
jgi:hypothetical protein